ncbi:hypothetical protein P43SY_008806 [Pythium insidiosum]|uniref:Spindle pole body component n=1 Tax=Pythium insidiosum TaxID=114742 RepID=A0AAD5M6B7_PYTIN|nr:hypothetical protein P43SY_008806 [Pythium insidiosum]
MHHELFFALVGHPGDLIDDSYRIRPDVTFLSAPQKEVLNRLLQLGAAYSALEQFTQHAATAPSLYVRGMAQYVERILQQYAEAVAQLEEKVLSTRVVYPLEQLVFELEEYAESLPAVVKVVRAMHHQAARAAAADSKGDEYLGGARLLELLHRLTDSGFPRIRVHMQQLLHSCHRIVYKQIVTWLLYGDVIDPYDEFFIKRQATDVVSAQSAADGVSVEEEIWQTRYSLDLGAVPMSYFPIPVAESVLFIGKSIQVLSHAKGFSPAEAQDVVEAFQSLSAHSEFNAVALEHTVERIRMRVASRLYSEIVVKTDFVRHLHLLKELFLLARGELFQALIERSSTLMAAKPAAKAADELQHGVWVGILRDFQVDEQPWARHFSLQIPEQGFRFSHFGALDGLVLRRLTQDGPRNKQVLQVEDGGAGWGTAWWPHPQRDHLSFVSQLALRLDPSTSIATHPRVALLLSRDSALAPASLSAGRCFSCDAPRSVSAIVELHLAPAADASASVAVHSTIAMNGDAQDAQVSSAKTVDVSDGALRVFVQYARVESRDPVSANVMFQRCLLVVVNDVIVVEMRFDLSPLFPSGASSHDHYVGLALSNGLRLERWSLDKFGPQATALPGRSLAENHESLSAHDMWNYLSMHCELPWPLPLLVSRDLVRSYSELFQFCFRVKRVAHALERTWKSAVLRPRRRVDAERASAIAAACALRGRMSFVLRNLELYFHVFVIDSHFKRCIADVADADDFDRVKRTHERFVAALVKRFFLRHSRAASAAVDAVLRCCWEFAEYLLFLDGQDSPELSGDRVALLQGQFRHKFGYLFTVLERMDARDLILLLDFNECFSRELRDDEPAHGTRRRQAAPSSSSSLATSALSLESLS